MNRCKIKYIFIYNHEVLRLEKSLLMLPSSYIFFKDIS